MPTTSIYADAHITGTVDTPANATGAADGTWAGVTNANTSATSRWSMGALPANGILQSTQTINVLARKGSNTGTPTVAINLYENGSLVQSIAAATNVTSTTGQTVSGTFASSAITNPANVEIQVVIAGVGGSGSVRNSAQIDSITWVADYYVPTTSDLVGLTDNNHGHTVEAVVLTQVHILTVADCVHGHTTDSAGALTQIHNLAANDSIHAHTVDAAPLTQVHILAGVADSVHASTVDSAGTLAEQSTISAVSDAAHGHTVDAVALTQVHTLTGVADAAHGHTVESGMVLDRPGYAMGYTSGYVAPSTTSLVVNDVAHGHTVDAVTVVGNSSLVVADVLHGHTSAPEGGVVFTEDWTGTNNDPWNSTDWPNVYADGSVWVQTDTNRGRISSTATGYRSGRAVANVGGLTDVDLLVRIDTSNVGSNEAYIFASVRASGGTNTEKPTNGYQFLLMPMQSQTRMSKHVAGVETVLIPGAAWTRYNGWNWVRVQAIGTTIRYKIWPDDGSTPEPSTWTGSATDTSVASGGVDLSVTHNGVRAVYYDDLTVTSVSSLNLTQNHVLTVADSLHAHSADAAPITQVHALSVTDVAHGHTADPAGTLAQQHNLSVLDANHLHAAESTSLTQVHSLAVQDSLHAHSAESPALTTQTTLVVDDASHEHSADSVALTQVHALAVSDALHAHTSDAASLGVALVVSDVAHAHSSDSVVITQSHALVVSDVTHAHTSESPAITKQSALEGVADSPHSHSAESPLLTQQHALTVSDAAHTHSSEPATLFQDHTLSGVSAALHGHSSEAPTFAQGHVLSGLADAFHGHSVETVALSQVHTLVVDEVAHAHSVETVQITQAHVLTVDDAAHVHAVESFALTQIHNLAPLDAQHEHSADSVAITQAHSLSVTDVAHDHTADTVGALTQIHVVSPSDVEHGHFVESVNLTLEGSLEPSDAFHSHISDPIALAQAHTLSGVADSSQAHSVDSIELAQTHVLLVDDSHHAHSTDNVAFTQDHALAVSNVQHEHAVESVSLTSEGVLAVDDSFHGHAAESVAVTQEHTLTDIPNSVHESAVTSNLVGENVLEENLSTFEGGSVGYILKSGVGTIEVSSELARTGTYSMAFRPSEFTALTAASPEPLFSTWVSPGTTYCFSAWVRSEVVTDRPFQIGIQWHDASFNHLGAPVYGQFATTSTSQWAQITADVTAPSSAVYAELIITATTEGYQVGETHYWDDISLALVGAEVSDVVLTQVHTLVVDDAAHSHSSGSVDLTGEGVLVVSDAQHGHSVESSSLAQIHTLIVDDTIHEHSTNPVPLFQEHFLGVVESVYHTHTSDIPLLYPIVVEPVILNNAVAVYLGPTPVEKVYLGETQVWP